jgi:hypothetical protein
MGSLGKIVIGLIAAAACAPLSAQQLTDAQRSAIKSACRGDYQQVCANVPPGTKDSLQCLLQHSQQVSSGCRDALAPAAVSSAAPPASSATPSPASAASAAAPAGAPATPPSGGSASSAPQPAHALSPRQEAMELRTKCGGDFQKLCSGVQPGGGRAVACLRAHAADLSPGCQSALTSAAAQ